MTLRNSVMAKIMAALEKSPFTPLDFSVDAGDRSYLLEVTFIHQPTFRFLVGKSGKGYYVTMAPGSHETTETVTYESLENIDSSLLSWTRFIRDELRATVPVYAAVDDLREALEQHINDHIQNPQSAFSDEEADLLREKLDALSQKFAEMELNHELTQQELNRLNQELASIKANLDAYPKGVWYKTAANKLWVAMSKVATSKESRLVLAKATQKMLGLDP